MQPMEHAIRNQLLPSFLGINTVDVDIKFRELLALAAKRGGLGIHNPMATAEDYFNTTMDACSYLVLELSLIESRSIRFGTRVTLRRQ